MLLSLLKPGAVSRPASHAMGAVRRLLLAVLCATAVGCGTTIDYGGDDPPAGEEAGGQTEAVVAANDAPEFDSSAAETIPTPEPMPAPLAQDSPDDVPRGDDQRRYEPETRVPESPAIAQDESPAQGDTFADLFEDVLGNDSAEPEGATNEESAAAMSDPAGAGQAIDREAITAQQLFGGAPAPPVATSPSPQEEEPAADPLFDELPADEPVAAAPVEATPVYDEPAPEDSPTEETGGQDFFADFMGQPDEDEFAPQPAQEEPSPEPSPAAGDLAWRPTTPQPAAELPSETPMPAFEPEPAPMDTFADTMPPADDTSDANAAPAMTPIRIDAGNTRHLAWVLGSKVSYTALSEVAALEKSEEDDAWQLEAIAEMLSVAPPEGLEAASDSPAKALSVLLSETRRLASELASRFGDDHAALMEVAVKSNALVLIYEKKPALAAAVRRSVQSAAVRAGLGDDSWRPLVELLDASPSVDEVRDEVFRLHSAIERELQSPAG